MAEPEDLKVQGFVVAFLRKLAGDRSQTEFGKATRVDQADLSKYERGERKAPEDSLRRMAEEAGVDEPFVALLRRIFAALLTVVGFRKWGVGEPTLEVLRPVLLAVVPYLLLDEWEPEISPEEARREAAETWAVLEAASIRERRFLIELAGNAFQKFPLALRIAEASVEAASRDEDEARELADLSTWIAGQAAQNLLNRRRPGDAARATLDLAEIWLGAGRTAEARELAAATEPILHAKGLDDEAIAALRRFCDAAKREAATLELARRVGEQLQGA